MVQIVPLAGRRVSVRYADGSCVAWDTRTEQASPDDTPLRPDSSSLQIAPNQTLRTNGAALQLLDGAGAVLASCGMGHASAAAPSFDAGLAVVAGASATLFAVATQPPHSIVLKSVFGGSPVNVAFISGRRIVTGHQGA